MTSWSMIQWLRWYFLVIEEFPFERWTHHITRHETFNVWLSYEDLFKTITHATPSIFSLHSLAEAPVDMTRRIAATYNCNKRCPLIVIIIFCERFIEYIKKKTIKVWKYFGHQFLLLRLFVYRFTWWSSKKLMQMEETD